MFCVLLNKVYALSIKAEPSWYSNSNIILPPATPSLYSEPEIVSSSFITLVLCSVVPKILAGITAVITLLDNSIEDLDLLLNYSAVLLPGEAIAES